MGSGQLGRWQTRLWTVYDVSFTDGNDGTVVDAAFGLPGGFSSDPETLSGPVEVFVQELALFFGTPGPAENRKTAENWRAAT